MTDHKSNRKSTIYEDKKGNCYYQTWSFKDTYGNKKKRIQKYLGKNLTKTDQKKFMKKYDQHYDFIDSKTIKGNPVLRNPETLEKVIKDYIKYNTQRVEDLEISPRYLRDIKTYLKSFVEWANKKDRNQVITEFQTDQINKYKIHRTRKKLTTNTIKNDLTYIKGFFKWATNESYILKNPFNHTIKVPTYQSKTRDQIPIGDEWDQLYSFISRSLDFEPTTMDEKKKWTWFNHNKDFRHVLFIMLNTGMRGGEVIQMKWKKGTTDHGKPKIPYVYLNRNMTSVIIYFKRTLAELELPENITDLLKERRKIHGDHKFVFHNSLTNGHLRTEWLSKNFRRLCNGLGLVDKDTQQSLFTPHSVRHGVISELLNQGVKIEEISKTIARHSDIGTTYNIYGHMQKGQGKSILERLNK